MSVSMRLCVQKGKEGRQKEARKWGNGGIFACNF